MDTLNNQGILDAPLAAAHANAGATMGAWFGCALPDHFGDWRAEYRAARESAALIDKNYRAYLSFTGVDRVRYLNAILTSNIRDLKPGEANVSLLLSPQGHILAEIETYAMQEHFLSVSYAMIRGRLIETIEKFIIMDDVTLTDDTDRLGTLAVEGPKTRDLVRDLCGIDLDAMPELGHTEAKVNSVPCRLVRRSPGAVVGGEFVAERAQLPELWETLLGAVRTRGGTAMGYTALSARRLEQGIPWFGYDFDEHYIPHEAGLEASHISYTKGCYTGQEIVERVRSRGHVNRVRVGLKFSSGEPPRTGTPLVSEGNTVGQVTRAAFSPALGSAIGMGYVRREHSAPGSHLSLADASAEVISLPIPQ